MHTHAATACFFVLDARCSAEIRIASKDAVEDVKGAAAARGGGGARRRPCAACSVPIFFLVRQEESDLLFFFCEVSDPKVHLTKYCFGHTDAWSFRKTIVKFALAKLAPCIRVRSQ
eukprot:SAG22_NODE_6575_length_836_cov_44.424695_1_plen_115_part_10